MKKTVVFAFYTLVVILSSVLPVRGEILLDEGFENDFTSLLELRRTWAIWGPQAGKVPANFTRDQTMPGVGKSCLRIRRPGGVSNQWYGLPVTNPQFLRPQHGMKYTISFMARSPETSTASLGIFSYRELNPAVNGPNLGIKPFQTGPEWQRYTFSVTEGCDFFAADANYLYFAFFISSDLSRERIMWLDDVKITAEPVTELATRLIDESTLKIDPVPLRLTPGDQLRIEIDASKRLPLVNRLVGGSSMLSLNRWIKMPFDSTGVYVLPPILEESIRELQLPLTRFYGVLEGEPFATPEEALDKIAEFLAKVKIPQETTIIELEDYHANRCLEPADWSRTVAYSLRRGYRFRHWEVGNEVFMLSIASSGKAGHAFREPEDYIRHFNAVAKAIRQVQPDAKIGLSVTPDSLKWGNYLVKSCAGNYDFVCPHWYGYMIDRNFEATVLGENHEKLYKIQRWNALLRAASPNRTAIQYDSEWGLHEHPANGKSADSDVRNGNIFGVVYRAVRMLYYARENVIGGACGWNTLSNASAPGFAMLYANQPERRSMLYWLYYHFNRHLGHEVLDLQGTAPAYRLPPQLKLQPEFVPATPAMATLDKDGKTLNIMLVNAFDARAVKGDIVLSNFVVGKIEAIVLGGGDFSTSPILERMEDFVKPLSLTQTTTGFTCELPPRSVVFIRLSARL